MNLKLKLILLLIKVQGFQCLMKSIESLHDSSSTPIIIDFDKQSSILNSKLNFKLQLDATIQVLKCFQRCQKGEDQNDYLIT